MSLYLWCNDVDVGIIIYQPWGFLCSSLLIQVARVRRNIFLHNLGNVPLDRLESRMLNTSRRMLLCVRMHFCMHTSSIKIPSQSTGHSFPFQKIIPTQGGIVPIYQSILLLQNCSPPRVALFVFLNCRNVGHL